jgi:hypothetical protein
VYRACPHCGEQHSAREIWPHRKKCALNPKNLPKPPEPAPKGKVIECRRCGHQTVKLHFRKHLLACPALIGMVGPGQKVCTSCQEVRAVDEFPAHCSSPDGFGNLCKPCTRKLSLDWYHTPKNHLSRRQHMEQKLYGVAPERRAELEAEQNGLCAICEKPPSGRPKNTRLAIDHDHRFPGTHRALLCEKCNTGLGGFDDDPALLMKAILYLQNHRRIEIVS